jgi:hypothetical protein
VEVAFDLHYVNAGHMSRSRLGILRALVFGSHSPDIVLIPVFDSPEVEL